ncbi:MAG: ComEC/Rec2 family competence protein [Chloroflexi bacterium]|nr:ComEC/Rec2 family competence protein [Chloroflexota bacterium]
MRLIYLALSWLLGIWLAEALGTRDATAFWLLLAIGCCVAIGLAWWQQQPRLRELSLVLLFLPLGALRIASWPQSDAVAELANRGGITLVGVVSSEPAISGITNQFQLSVREYLRAGGREPIRGRVWVRARRETAVAYGDHLQVTGTLSEPRDMDAFSYADYLARQGVFSVMTSAHVQHLGSGYGNRLRTLLGQVRQEARERIGQVLAEPEAGLLAGILLGDESGISEPVYDDFSRVGAAHVIAISGFNMTMLAGILNVLLERMGIGRWRLLWVLVLWIGLYTLLVGASPSVLRAAVMSVFLMLGYALGRRVNILTSLAAGTLILTLANPTLLWDVGFQLSAGGVLGIGVCFGTQRWRAVISPQDAQPTDAFHPRREWQRFWRSAWHLLRSIVLVTLAASLFTVPLVAAHFGHLSPWWVLVNLLIIPVQGLVLSLGMLATLLSFIAPPLAEVIFWFAFLALRWTVTVVRTFADFPLASVPVSLSPTLLGLWFVALTSIALVSASQPRRWQRWLNWLSQRWLLWFALLVTCLLLILLAMRWRARPDGHLHVWFLDVGNSNGIFIQTPGGAQVLIDGGRHPERLLTQIGDRMPFYDRRIELLLLSQTDVWDISALTALLRRYEVGLVASNGRPIEDVALWELREALAQQEMVALRTGHSLRFGDGVRLDVLHPKFTPDREARLDDGVLALRLQYGAVSFLFTGDSSTAAQADWLAELQPVTVLQLPQHGAARSLHDELLSRSAAQYLVLNLEENILGGGPDPDLLAELSAERPLFRTDRLGVVHFRSDGQSLVVSGSSLSGSDG